MARVLEYIGFAHLVSAGLRGENEVRMGRSRNEGGGNNRDSSTKNYIEENSQGASLENKKSQQNQTPYPHSTRKATKTPKPQTKA